MANVSSTTTRVRRRYVPPHKRSTAASSTHTDSGSSESMTAFHTAHTSISPPSSAPYQSHRQYPPQPQPPYHPHSHQQQHHSQQHHSQQHHAPRHHYRSQHANAHAPAVASNYARPYYHRKVHGDNDTHHEHDHHDTAHTTQSHSHSPASSASLRTADTSCTGSQDVRANIQHTYVHSAVDSVVDSQFESESAELKDDDDDDETEIETETAITIPIATTHEHEEHEQLEHEQHEPPSHAHVPLSPASPVPSQSVTSASSPQPSRAPTANDIAFERHLNDYKQEHKYLAPFAIRRLRHEFDLLMREQKKKQRKEKQQQKQSQKQLQLQQKQEENDENATTNVTSSPQPQPCADTCADTITVDDETKEVDDETKDKEDKDGGDENKKKSDNNCEHNHHSVDDEENCGECKQSSYFPTEYLFFREFYLQNSAHYSTWQDMRHTGWTNQHLEQFFTLKHKNQDNHSRSSDKNIVSLFRRFYRYAIDIDNVCGYAQHLVHSLSANASGNGTSRQYAYFLDIGFAPGGMSRLLLDAHPNIYGVGVTLPPYECGNAYVSELLHMSRFLCREHDIVALGKKVQNRADFMTHCLSHDYSTPQGGGGDQSVLHTGTGWREFAGFDLVIVGITCHQDFNSNERLDHQILLSELYVAFLTLNHGGSILIRHKIALDCIHQHILFVFLKCFGAYQVGKPLTEFAIRKTFWVLWKDFDAAECQRLQLVPKLRKLIQEYDGTQPPYGKNPDNGQYHNPSMIDKTPPQMMEELPTAFIDVMDPVFAVQMRSLQSFCDGKKDRLCNAGAHCKRNDCNRAHCAEECMHGFYEALCAVDEIMFREAAEHRHHSRILAALHANQKRRNNNGNSHNKGKQKRRKEKGNQMNQFHHDQHHQAYNDCESGHGDWRKSSKEQPNHEHAYGVHDNDNDQHAVDYMNE